MSEPTTIRVLLIESDARDADSVFASLNQADGVRIDVQKTDRLCSGLGYLADNSIDVVLLDLDLPDSSGLDTLRRIHAQRLDVPVVVLTVSENLEEGLQVIRQGATDYLAKSELTPSLLSRTIRYAIERNRAQQALSASEQRYRQLLAAVTTYTYTVEIRDGVPVSTEHGQGCLATTGYTAGDFAADPYLWFRMVHADDREVVRQHVARVVAGEQAGKIEHRIIHREGATRWVRDTMVPHFDAAGQLVRYDGLIEDISERKRLEGVLREQEAELRIAQAIQRRFLPDVPPSLSGFDMAAALYPAEFTAGDFFDYLPMRDGSMGLVVGDVSGHGVGPALLMASSHMLLRSLVETHTDVAAILRIANSVLCKETDEGRFVTLFFGCLDPQSRSFTFASAGHPSGYVLDAAGEVKALLERTALPLAISRDAEFVCGTPVTVSPGDLVLLLTDGILEARSAEGTLFGVARTLECVRLNRARPAAEIVEEVCQTVRAFSEGQKLLDDVTVLILKVAARD